MGTEYIKVVVFVLYQLWEEMLKRGQGRCKIKEAGIFSWKEISCLSNMCTKYINNHKFSIHMNFTGTGTHTYTEGYRVCPASASTPCACSLPPGALIGSCPIRPSNHIRQSESVHRLANNLRFYNNTPQPSPPLSVFFFPVLILLSSKKVMNVMWWM